MRKTQIQSNFIALPISIVLLMGSTFSCATAGMGQVARTDIQKQMATIKEPVAKCYRESLHERSRRIEGSITLRFKIEPKTGKFIKVAIARTNLFISDPKLEQCVVQEVSKLALAKPHSTIIGIDSYPVEFSPSN